MSTLSDLLGDVWALLFPAHCAVCGAPLVQGERSICTFCRLTAPLTGYCAEAANPLLDRCRDLVPVHRASALLFFVRQSGWRRLIHSFKYRGMWCTAQQMGVWYGACLRQGGLYDDVDCVIPLPLHPFKRLRRGYNQSEYIARGIASQLGVGVDSRSVRRIRNTRSQARLPRRERAHNVEAAFAVAHPEQLSGRHILLIDDVLTTGSTLLSCAAEILRAAPDCRVSVAVLAVSRRGVGLRD